ncbi:MAG: hypothetical protein SOT07_07930 [Paludibacteraceae bacterium]|nr:hypothetical protein [Paludibacteraceae bacterium]
MLDRFAERPLRYLTASLNDCVAVRPRCERLIESLYISLTARSAVF